MTSRQPLRILAALSCFVVVACGGSDDDAGGDAPADTTTTTLLAAPATEPPATEPPATEPPATDPPATEPPATEPPATDPPSDGSCLVGSWLVTQDEMNAYYDALAANTDTGAGALEIDVVGQTLFTFTADTYVYTGDFSLSLSVAGQSGTGVTSGSVTGTYTTADGVITTELGESSLSVEVTVAGVTLDGSDLANGLLTDLPINNAPFDCSGPTIDFLAGAAGERHTVTLTPA